MRRLVPFTSAVFVLALVVLYGCRDSPDVTEPSAATTSPVGFASASQSSPAVLGRWAAPFSTPVLAVHVHLLRNGKVLLWGDNGDAQLWSASTGFTRVPSTSSVDAAEPHISPPSRPTTRSPIPGPADLQCRRCGQLLGLVA